MSEQQLADVEISNDVPPSPPVTPVPTARSATGLLPQFGRQSSIERRLAVSILKLDPGMGPKSQEIAHVMCDAGLNPSFAVTLIRAIYAPTDPMGRGQSTRINHAVKAIQNRYGHRLDVIKHDVKRCKVFIAEMEDVFDMRDTIRGEGFSITFEQAFLLWELGYDADSVLGIIQEQCGQMSPVMATKMVVKSAQSVQAGFFMEVETAIESMRYGYEYDYDHQGRYHDD